MKLLALGLVLWSSIVNAQSFEGIKDFRYQPISGRLWISCYEGGVSQTVYAICREDLLEPFERGYFSVDESVDADQVELSSVWASGKTVTKETQFDKDQKRSAKKINLWISSLFQTPLLDEGVNQVTYTLKNQGAIVYQGQTEVKVERHPVRTCGVGHASSMSMMDCTNTTNKCYEYFKEQNWCKK